MTIAQARVKIFRECNPARFSARVYRGSAVLSVFLVILLFMSGAAAQTATKPLTLQNVQDLLNGKVPPKRVGQIAQERGLDFALTPAIEEQLRDTLQHNGT